MSIHRKTFAFTSKQCPQALKHIKIHGKTFAVQSTFAETENVLALESFVLAIWYSIINFVSFRFRYVTL